MTSSSNNATSRSIKRRFKLLNQFRLVTRIGRTTRATHIPRISAQTVTSRLREIDERPPYAMYVLYAAFLLGLVYMNCIKLLNNHLAIEPFALMNCIIFIILVYFLKTLTINELNESRVIS